MHGEKSAHLGEGHFLSKRAYVSLKKSLPYYSEQIQSPFSLSPLSLSSNFLSTEQNSGIVMASREDRGRSLIPSFIYSSSSSKMFGLEAVARTSRGTASGLSSAPTTMTTKTTSERLVISAPREKIEMYSPAFYAACTAGGIFSCGLTHVAVTPLDLVKCNMQVSLSLSVSLV